MKPAVFVRKITFGGPGRLKKSCVPRQCQGKLLPATYIPIIPTVNNRQDQRDQLTYQKQEQLRSFPDKRAPAPPRKQEHIRSIPDRSPAPEFKRLTGNLITCLLLQKNSKNSTHHRSWQSFSLCPPFFLFGTEQQHVRVQTEIVNFVSENVRLFEALVISDYTSHTLLDHLESMEHPIVWATQVEIQVAIDLYGIPVYLFTPNPSGSG